MLIYRAIARRLPGLGLKLRQARMRDTATFYIQKTLLSSLMLSLTLCFVLFGFLKSFVVILFFPVFFIISFGYFLRYVDTKIIKIKNDINREIVFAGRFLIIELESGVPMYNSFQNMTQNYPAIGKYFAEIVEKVDLGTSLEESLNDTILTTPSEDLRKLLWQLLNSLRTGSNVTKSMDSVLDQIVREQKISVNEYGRKLNPLAMFYMMVAIIIPSLGIVMLIILASFIGITLSLAILSILAFLILFVQFMFLALIKNSRPAVEI